MKLSRRQLRQMIMEQVTPRPDFDAWEVYANNLLKQIAREEEALNSNENKMITLMDKVVSKLVVSARKDYPEDVGKEDREAMITRGLRHIIRTLSKTAKQFQAGSDAEDWHELTQVIVHILVSGALDQEEGYELRTRILDTLGSAHG